MATTLLQQASQAVVGTNAGGACFPAFLPAPSSLATATTTPPYTYPVAGSASPGYTIPFTRFLKASGAFANGDFVDDLVMPAGFANNGGWLIYDYTANATPALAAPVVLGMVTAGDANFSLGSIGLTDSFTSGYILPSATTTPPYIYNNQVLPYLRFAQLGALANGSIVADLVMPHGSSMPASFYVVRYTLNASLQLT